MGTITIKPEMPEIPSREKCSAVRTNGKPCANFRRVGEDYCGFHKEQMEKESLSENAPPPRKRRNEKERIFFSSFREDQVVLKSAEYRENGRLIEPIVAVFHDHHYRSDDPWSIKELRIRIDEERVVGNQVIELSHEEALKLEERHG